MRKKTMKTYSINTPVQYNDGELDKKCTDTSMSPDKVILNEERSNIMEIAFDEWPANYKTAIIMRHSEEKSYEEISLILNIPLGTVKARIFRAREMLKNKLKDKALRH